MSPKTQVEGGYPLALESFEGGLIPTISRLEETLSSGIIITNMTEGLDRI
jgi:hypothetical protein